MPHIKDGELQLYYETYGRGEPLVLIPGFRTGLWLWFKQAEALARKCRVIIFDPRGIGQSVYTGEPFTMETLADDLAGLLDSPGIDSQALTLETRKPYDLRKDHGHGRIRP